MKPDATNSNLALLAVPWDSGRRAWRMGRGPVALLESGLATGLEARGAEVSTQVVEADAEGEAEEVIFELCRRVAREVKSLPEGTLPVLLAGNCSLALGAVAGMGERATAVVWLDAHGDINTPDTSTSGWIDGMALAMVTGRAHTDRAAGLEGFRPVDEGAAVLVGARDLDQPERAYLDRGAMGLVSVEAVRTRGVPGAMDAFLEPLAREGRSAYLHVDLDVLDPGEGRANSYATPGGLTGEELLEVARTVRRRLPLGGLTLASYDPEEDEEGRVLAWARALVEDLPRRPDEPA